MRAVILSFLLSLPVFLSSVQGQVPASDLTVIPGERVGAITPGMNLERLKQIYGAAVAESQIPGPEGSSFEGAYLFKGTRKELEIIWNPEAPEKKVVSHIRVLGKAWKFQNGLKPGQSLAEVEKINGAPFKVWGFEWDMGGYADFEGGKLAGKVSVRFQPKARTLAPSIIGDQQVSTASAELRAAKPVVSELAVMFP